MKNNNNNKKQPLARFARTASLSSGTEVACSRCPKNKTKYKRARVTIRSAVSLSGYSVLTLSPPKRRLRIQDSKMKIEPTEHIELKILNLSF